MYIIARRGFKQKQIKIEAYLEIVSALGNNLRIDFPGLDLRLLLVVELLTRGPVWAALARPSAVAPAPSIPILAIVCD
jgi:hypothetical protein